jgi:hypothetical protein
MTFYSGSLTVTLMQSPTASPTVAVSNGKVITGAGGVGAAKSYFRFKPSPSLGRFIRVQFTGGASFGNASAKSGVIALVF